MCVSHPVIPACGKFNYSRVNKVFCCNKYYGWRPSLRRQKEYVWTCQQYCHACRCTSMRLDDENDETNNNPFVCDVCLTLSSFSSSSSSSSSSSLADSCPICLERIDPFSDRPHSLVGHRLFLPVLWSFRNLPTYAFISLPKNNLLKRDPLNSNSST